MAINPSSFPDYGLDNSSERSVNTNAMGDNVQELAMPLMNVKEVAERLNIGIQSLYKLINSNQLRTIKIGTRRLVTPHALAEYIRSLEDASRQGGNYGF